jgi:subtilase family serine protease
VPSLSSGTQSDITVSLDLPSGLSPGYWYVIARADADGVETETQEANNTTARLITIGPDLAVPAFAVPASAGAGAGLTVTASVKNQGGGSAGSSVTRFFLSANAVWDSTDLALEGRLDVSALSPGASASGTATVMLPANVAAGSYYVLAMADGDGAVVETQEANNAAARFVQIGGDLVVSGVTAPARAAVGGALAVTDTTKNHGAGAIGASVTRFHLSANALLDAGDVLLAAGRPVPALTAGASNTGTTTVVLPGQVAPGTWYLIAKADGDAAVSETLETNNTLARSVTVGPDLVISAMTVPYNVRAGGAVAVNDTVQNQGLDPAGTTVTRFYLSSNVAFDANDVLLDGARVVGPLAGGASSVGSSSVTIPAGTAPGPWFVIARTDAGDTVTESTESSNLAARAVEVAPCRLGAMDQASAYLASFPDDDYVGQQAYWATK